MFDRMMQDRIVVIKADGTRSREFKAVVARDKIVFDDTDFPLDDGDFIERRLPHDRVELYEVLESGYQPGMGSIPDHYQATVRKTTSRVPPRGGPTTNVTLSGPNARINVNSIDASTNVVNGDIDPREFDELINKLKEAVPAGERERLVDQVQAMRQVLGSAEYNRAFQDFIQLAANWMTIVAPFIPALTRALNA